MKKENLRKEKGITLIALVITIIVLLILAGVTIATLTGDNGILTKANNTKTETEKAGEDEKLKLAIMGSYGLDRKLNLADLKRNLTEQGISYIDSSSFPLIATVNGESIEIKEDGKQEKLFNAAEWDKTATSEDCFVWGSNTEGEEGYDVIVGYTNKLENEIKLKIPSRCVRIQIGSFNGSGESRSFCSEIKTIEIPNTVIDIGNGAFAGGSSQTGFRSLENVSIPNSVSVIGYDTFDNCQKLTNIEIPEEVTRIENGAFYDCKSLTSITISNNVVHIGSWTFGGCESLTNINIKKEENSISDSPWGAPNATITWNYTAE